MIALPLLVALLGQGEEAYARPPLDPALLTERTALLGEMRAAPALHIQYADAEKKPKTRTFRMEVGKPTAGGELLQAVEADFLLCPNAGQARCGFHTDIAIVAKGERTLKLELCFGCGLVRIERPERSTRWPGNPVYVYWAMVKPNGLKTTVRTLIPEAWVKPRSGKG